MKTRMTVSNRMTLAAAVCAALMALPGRSAAAACGCDCLPSVGTVEDITPADFHNPANLETFAVAVNPQQPNIVFTAAGNITNGGGCPSGQTCPAKGTGVYVSKDCGKSFVLLSTGPTGAFSSGNLWNIRIDPVHTNTMYLMNGYGGPPTLFKSVDSGATWTNLFTAPIFGTPSNGGIFTYGGFVRSFDIEAANPSHLVIAFHENCMGSIASSASDAVSGAIMCLAESRDGGATWNFFEGPITASSADGGAPIILPNNALLYANPGDGNGNTAWYTSDSSRSRSAWKAVMTYNQSGPFNAINQSGAYFDPSGALYLPGGSHVVYTSPGATFGQTWNVIAASPGSMVLCGDGLAAAQNGTLFASTRVPGQVHQIYSAPLSNFGTFAHFNTPANFNGVSGMAYDAVHHVLYGAAAIQGLWRIVTGSATNAGSFHRDAFATKMLQIVPQGIVINAGSSWHLDLFGLNGERIDAISGTGKGEVSLEHAARNNRFAIARLTSASAAVAERIVLLTAGR